MADRTIGLVHEFTYRMSISAPHKVGFGPYGDRQYYDIAQGSIEGRRLSGRLIGSAADWMLVGADGFMRMDVRLQVETDDGATICAHYFGPAEANETLLGALAACEPTEFADQRIRTHWLLESGDPRYLWVNQSVFVGEGRLRPFGEGVLGFEHRVYQVA